jgi:hypothetical protein
MQDPFYDIKELYYKRLADSCDTIASEHKGYAAEVVTLHCLLIRPNTKVAGFTIASEGGRHGNPRSIKWQYNLRGYNLGRPKAYRVPFLGSPQFDNEDFTVSHLCHNSWCHNPRHHTLESLADNKGRNGCPGGLICVHQVACLIPGPFCEGNTSVPTPERANELFIV